MKRWILFMASVCLLLCGCTKSNIVYGDNKKYDDQYQSVDGIVWEQVWQDFSDTYADQDLFPFAVSVNGGIYPEENMARFYLLVNGDVSDKEAAEYATKVLKGFNDLIAIQNSSYASSSEESYGGTIPSLCNGRAGCHERRPGHMDSGRYHTSWGVSPCRRICLVSRIGKYKGLGSPFFSTMVWIPFGEKKGDFVLRVNRRTFLDAVRTRGLMAGDFQSHSRQNQTFASGNRKPLPW